MSYILDALKKADQERTLGEVPDLEAAHWGERRRKRSYRWLWIVAALLLVNGVLLYLLLGRHDPVARDSDEASMQADPQAVTPVERSAAPPVRDRARPREPVYVPPAAPVAPVRRPPVSRVQQMPLAPKPVETESTPAFIPPAPVPSQRPEVTSDVPEWNDLSLEFRSSMTVPRIDVHVYSDDPARRFILVDLQKYREGETLANGAVLEEILPGSIQLYYQGTRFRLAK